MSIFEAGPYVAPVLLGLFALTAWGVTSCIGAWSDRRALRRTVYQNLDSAYGGGQFEADGYCAGLSAFELALDLTTYAEDCYDVNARKLVPHVRDWLFQKGLPCKG